MKRFTNYFCRFTALAGMGIVGSLGVYSSFSKAQELIPFPSPRPTHQVDQSATTQTSAPAATTAPSAVGQLIPFPVVRPNHTGTSQTTVAQTSQKALAGGPSTKGHSIAPLRNFFVAFDKKDGAGALRAKAALRHPLDKKIAAWMISTTSTRGFSHSTLLKNAQQVSNWPGGAAMRLARENTLVKRAKPAAWVARSLPQEPSTDDGKILQIKSLLASGQKSRAVSYLRKYWVSQNFSRSNEARILKSYGNLLSRRDHETRASRLLYDERANAALRLSSKISRSNRALMNARIAVIRRQKNAGSLLANLPSSAKSDPAYFFARVQHLRRADKWVSAGKVMVQAPRDPSRLVDLREWWIERRMVSRKVLEAGHPRLAYQIVSQFSTTRAVDRIDAQFHAGWYALRFAKDPKTALRHFSKIREISDKPLSLSRAHYWTGRAYQALKSKDQATRSYQQAARYPHTYYGQLALRQLGHNSIALPQLPKTAGAKTRFERHLFVQVIRRLNQAGQKGRTGIFYRHLAQTLKNPADVTLLAVLADQNRLFPISLQVGKLALSKGVNVPRLAFPLGAIPRTAGISNQDKAMAYAIARQESAFNVGAVSHADARGLMQLLPSTAKLTARRIGVAYRPSKLTRDGAYNAKLGSAFLNQLIKRFGGSYILGFAGYNAGPRRPDQWIKRFGDPRRNAVDAIDWVEMIPFSETRNYVQRVMENFQVYRHRLENAPLSIKKDLNKGRPT